VIRSLFRNLLLPLAPRGLFFDYFGTGEAWTVDAKGCKVYPIRKSQLPMLAARTPFERSK
jgi:hypothetical protein